MINVKGIVLCKHILIYIKYTKVNNNNSPYIDNKLS